MRREEGGGAGMLRSTWLKCVSLSNSSCSELLIEALPRSTLELTTFQSTMHEFADLPLETDVIIINVSSGRKLYARENWNWNFGFGAGFPADDVLAEGVWQIRKVDDGYKIISKAAGRILYAHKNGNWTSLCGAGSPENKVHSDGVWKIEKSGKGVIFTNNESERVLYASPDKNWDEDVGARVSLKQNKHDHIWSVIAVTPDDLKELAESKSRRNEEELKKILDIRVCIINVASKRKLYATNENWTHGFGAVFPNTQMQKEGVWRISRVDGGGYGENHLRGK